MADFDQANQAALKAELLSDQKGLGLVAMTDAQAAAALNQIGASGETIVISQTIDAYKVIDATDPSEWALLNATERQRYQTIVSAGKVDPTNANVKAAFQAMFGVGTATRAALIALATRSCSRAEKLFGDGVVVQFFDVRRARDS